MDHLGDVHGSRSGARPPIREAITKNDTYPLDGAPWLVTKTHHPLYIIKKREFYLSFPSDVIYSGILIPIHHNADVKLGISRLRS